MGLPGAGKTTLASKLVPILNAKWLNANEVRKEANDWDFSSEGRKRQARRMANFANRYESEGNIVIADFICPTQEVRELFNPDLLIWLDTIKKGRFEDTNEMFIKPEKFDFRVTTKNADIWGTFDGDLEVSSTLTIQEKGIVKGTTKYSSLQIKLGGQLVGDVQFIDKPKIKAVPSSLGTSTKKTI